MTWEEAHEALTKDADCTTDEAREAIRSMAQQIEANRLAIQHLSKLIDSQITLNGEMLESIRSLDNRTIGMARIG